MSTKCFLKIFMQTKIHIKLSNCMDYLPLAKRASGLRKQKKERTQSSRFRSLYVVLRRALHRRLHSHWFSKHSADSFVRQHLSLVRPQRKVWDVLSMDARTLLPTVQAWLLVSSSLLLASLIHFVTPPTDVLLVMCSSWLVFSTTRDTLVGIL